MFLKRIEMQGFKSFADKIDINFEDSITGIVGPNGCGKSNISDAIRWVLGEQSVKSLRGEKMTDIIFAGTESRKPVNLAEVTLVFDNSKHYLNSDKEEIEVTRRIYNTDQEAEYLINRKNVRLKDVIDLVLDSGLGKDSLSMISQGNISSFADAKPYDRRAIFEEAAGVSKYKKRKIESLNRLERTKENLDRTYDILQELERQVTPLKRQAKKAEIYREKKKRLQEIEIAVLVDDIKNLNSQREEIKKTLFDLETNLAMHQTTVQVSDNATFNDKQILKQYDKDINNLQEKLVSIVNEIGILETRKVELDEKRKYALEMGSSEEKLNQLRQLVEDSKFEYEDRLKRFNELKTELDLLNTNLEEIAVALSDASLKKEESLNILNKTNNRISLLENLLKDPFSSNAQNGVKAIIDNKSSIYGIMGVIGQEIHPKASYEYAINSALAGSIYHIVTKDEESARKAIDFLKKNLSGRATFLPLTVLKNREIKYEDRIICNNSAGFLGTCNEFAECAPEYDMVVDGLLGNVILCNTLENANNLASLLKYQYKIVTLDGEIVHKGGSITGGKVKNETSILTAGSELESLKNKKLSYDAQYELDEKAYNDKLNQKNLTESQITEKRILMANVEPVVDVKRAKYEKAKSDYESIAPEALDGKTNFENETVKQLSEAYSTKDSLSASLKIKRDERMKLNASIDRKEQQVRQIRRQIESDNESIRKISNEQATVNTKLENNLNRLASEYQMTFEYAQNTIHVELTGNEKEEVISLRKDIEALGNINMGAPEEFTEINERYEFLQRNYNDLIASRDKILAAIDEMDEIMKTQFLETFNAINGELNNTFKVLFGGGKAKLVLEDENDILNTGIDIDVQPPGKSVKSIRLFSGGEKTLIAMCVLFTILKIKPTPLIVFDEVEAALDQANVERFAKYVKNFSNESQFLIITHRPGTMAQCSTLYGVTMQNRGVSQMLKVKLVDAIDMAEKEPNQVN